MSEEFAADDEFEDEIEGDLVLKSGEEVDHKGVLQQRVGELKTPAGGGGGDEGANVTLISVRMLRSAMMCSLCFVRMQRLLDSIFNA